MRLKHALILAITLIGLLAGCTFEAGFEPEATETPTATENETVTPSATLTDTPTEIPESTETATPTDEPTEEPTDEPDDAPAESSTGGNGSATSGGGQSTAPPSQPTATPSATAPPAPQPTNTPGGTAPTIHSFDVTPGQASQDDTITATWSTSGGAVRLCLVQLIPGVNTEECFDDLPAEGTYTAEITDPVEGTLHVYLHVGDDQPNPVFDSRPVSFDCTYPWFTTPEVDLCPATAPIESAAAAQRFENGLMLYLSDPGLYITLFTAGNSPPYWLLADPLNVTRDTSGEVTAPEGLYAPESGFGLVWRGDVEGASGYRDALGWATAPEYGFTATYQCDRATSQWRFCYVTHPGGRVAVLHPLGTWYVVD